MLDLVVRDVEDEYIGHDIGEIGKIDEKLVRDFSHIPATDTSLDGHGDSNNKVTHLSHGFQGRKQFAGRFELLDVDRDR